MHLIRCQITHFANPLFHVWKVSCALVVTVVAIIYLCRERMTSTHGKIYISFFWTVCSANHGYS